MEESDVGIIYDSARACVWLSASTWFGGFLTTGGFGFSENPPLTNNQPSCNLNTSSPRFHTCDNVTIVLMVLSDFYRILNGFDQTHVRSDHCKASFSIDMN